MTLTELKDGQGRLAEGPPLMVAPGGQQAAGSGMAAGTYEYGYVDDRGVINIGEIQC